MKRKLNNTIDINGSNFTMRIAQYTTGSVVDEIITEISIDYRDELGKIKDYKIISFTEEEYDMFLKCLETNEK